VESYAGQHSVLFLSRGIFELVRVESGSVNVDQCSDCFWVMEIL
jgi:hypothetical protein